MQNIKEGYMSLKFLVNFLNLYTRKLILTCKIHLATITAEENSLGG